MSELESNSFEMSAGAKTPDGNLSDIRQQVEAAYAAIPDIEKLEVELAAAPDNAAKANSKGELIDSARRERIIKGEQAVADSFKTETMPKPEPSSPDQLLLG